MLKTREVLVAGALHLGIACGVVDQDIHPSMARHQLLEGPENGVQIRDISHQCLSLTTAFFGQPSHITGKTCGIDVEQYRHATETGNGRGMLVTEQTGATGNDRDPTIQAEQAFHASHGYSPHSMPPLCPHSVSAARLKQGASSAH